MRLLGFRAEKHAERFLIGKGLHTISRNYQCRYGELDLIMQDVETLVFVEVRQRTGQRFGTAAESISAAKQRRLMAAARHFLVQRQYGLNQSCRFDVVSIDGSLTHGQLHWIKNAFPEY